MDESTFLEIRNALGKMVKRAGFLLAQTMRSRSFKKSLRFHQNMTLCSDILLGNTWIQGSNQTAYEFVKLSKTFAVFGRKH